MPQTVEADGRQALVPHGVAPRAAEAVRRHKPALDVWEHEIMLGEPSHSQRQAMLDQAAAMLPQDIDDARPNSDGSAPAARLRQFDPNAGRCLFKRALDPYRRASRSTRPRSGPTVRPDARQCREQGRRWRAAAASHTGRHSPQAPPEHRRFDRPPSISISASCTLGGFTAEATLRLRISKPTARARPDAKPGARVRRCAPTAACPYGRLGVSRVACQAAISAGRNFCIARPPRAGQSAGRRVGDSARGSWATVAVLIEPRCEIACHCCGRGVDVRPIVERAKPLAQLALRIAARALDRCINRLPRVALGRNVIFEAPGCFAPLCDVAGHFGLALALLAGVGGHEAA